VWETHTADGREQITASTVRIILAIWRDDMAYCCISLPLLQRIGVQGDSIVRRGETCMSTPIRSTCLSGWFVCVLLVCIAVPNAWSDTDKTVVDLERGRPEAASRYHRPRAAHLYHYDQTAVDLAVPLAQQPPEEPRASQRPGTLTPAAPAPTPPPPQAPLPGGER